MKDLIERLEKASNHSRQLDAEIEVEVRRFQAYQAGLSDEQRAPWRVVSPLGEVGDGPCRYHAPCYTSELSCAYRLLPWEQHPGATFTLKTVQSGDKHYCTAEFTWPSTERYGRAMSPAIATVICALHAIEESERQLAPYRDKPRKRNRA